MFQKMYFFCIFLYFYLCSRQSALHRARSAHTYTHIHTHSLTISDKYVRNIRAFVFFSYVEEYFFCVHFQTRKIAPPPWKKDVLYTIFINVYLTSMSEMYVRLSAVRELSVCLCVCLRVRVYVCVCVCQSVYVCVCLSRTLMNVYTRMLMIY